MPTCAAACSDYSHAARVAARLNARFFNASGVGLEQGLLIHGLDHQTAGTKKQWFRMAIGCRRRMCARAWHATRAAHCRCSETGADMTLRA